MPPAELPDHVDWSSKSSNGSRIRSVLFKSPCTINQLAFICQLTTLEVESALDRLKDEGAIKAVGVGCGGATIWGQA